ncbi:ATPase [Devosia soli]|uniref:ATPase n=1 Tax=Devosia soli TaxID=361041 RepID=A0A0F5L441_9HYPH|nr:SRPBCC family protein [Devosia soli]KKB77113.1 ATPase [Devosia soli]
MSDATTTETIATKSGTVTSRSSERELRTTRVFEAPARLVFQAWSTTELLMRWWAPKSFGITFISCEADVRTGGHYRFVFGHPASDQPMAFFGKYLEVIPPTKIVWTNEESEEGSVTTMTLTEEGGRTTLVVSDVYPSKAALDEAIASGSTGAFPEQFEALDAILAELAGR